jgi:hypothetical protein
MGKQYDSIGFTRKFAQITPGFSEDLTPHSIIIAFLEEMKGYIGKDYLLLMPYFSSDYRGGKIKFAFDDEYQFIINKDYRDIIMQELAEHYSFKTGITEFFCNNFSKSAAVEMQCDKTGDIIVKLMNYGHGDLSSYVDDVRNKFTFKSLLDLKKVQAPDIDVTVSTNDQGLKNIVRNIKRGFVAHKPFLHDDQRVYFISEPNIIIKGEPRSTGGLFLVRKGEMTNQELSFFIISEFLLSSEIEITNDIINAHKNAVRAAIAQVMARNMSHNFGSHVLSNLIKTEVYDDLNDEIIKNSFTVYNSIFDENGVFVHEDSNDVSSPLKNQQLGYFNQYLKSRMDYLSEVTFGVSNLLTTKMMYSEVMKELDQVRILLNFISGVSDFKYKFKLVVVDVEGEEKEMTAENDIGVAFPSDVLGCHAFYNIIENIIRNTAKHTKNTGEVITFTIKFKDVDSNGCEGIEEASELYCVEIDNGVSEDGIDVLVDKQNYRLNQSVLENNSLRSSSLGLLEMEASAAFLRQIDLPEIESDDYFIDNDNNLFHKRNGKKRLNILKAFAVDLKEEERENEEGKTINVKTGRLGYRFFMQKPKEFLFVGNWAKVKDRNRLLTYGVRFVESKVFMDDLIKGKSFSHQFLIYDDTLCKMDKERDEKLKPYDSLLPLRRIHDDGESAETKKTDFFTLKGKALLQNLKEFAWERYFEEVIVKELKNKPKNNKIVIQGACNPESKNCQIVFLDHSNEEQHIKDCKGINKEDSIEAWVENLVSKTCGKLPEFQKYCKGDGEKIVDNYISGIKSGDGIKKRIRQELFEAYHNKVIILDERIQKFAEENSEGSSKGGNKLIPCWRLFGSTNVFIPRRPKKDEKGDLIPLKDWNDDDLIDWDGTALKQDKVFSLDPNDFDKHNKELVENYVKNRMDNAFILVHYGVLERMYNGEEGLINDTLEAWAAKAKRVVVTSGRGAHSLNLPESVCFANLSSVLYACVENRNKYIINYLLNQSRRKRNE